MRRPYFKGNVRRDTRGGMNKTESRYAAYLELLYKAGEILWWKRSGIKLRLADRTFLDIDFAVQEKDGTLALHEVKGHMEDDAWVKLKVAAEAFPFRIVVVREVKGRWEITEV